MLNAFWRYKHSYEALNKCLSRELELAYMCELTESIENTRNTDFYTILAVIAISEGFCDALAFVVAGADPNRVDVTPAGNTVNSEWNRNVR